MVRFGMVIKTNRCIGCQTCSIACKMQNNIPQNMLWNRVLANDANVLDGSSGDYPNLTKTFVPVACQHCANAACQKACPTGATYRDGSGRVQINYGACIGCRMCMAACPYNARVFNWNDPVRDPDFNYGDKRVPVRQKGVVEKCTMCRERTDHGDEPMCVITCMGKARIFGDLDDPNSEVAELVQHNNAVQLLDEKGTDPQVYYVL